MPRMQNRRGTAAEWSSLNPVLHPGELGVETDTGMMKIGNGTDPWNARPYVQGQPIPPGKPAWGDIIDKPPALAAGATAAQARDAIGAGTSNLGLGTTSTTAAPGDMLPALVATLPASPVTGKLYCLPE